MNPADKQLLEDIGGLSDDDRACLADMLAADTLHPSIAHFAPVKAKAVGYIGFFSRVRAIKITAPAA